MAITAEIMPIINAINLIATSVGISKANAPSIIPGVKYSAAHKITEGVAPRMNLNLDMPSTPATSGTMLRIGPKNLPMIMLLTPCFVMNFSP